MLCQFTVKNYKSIRDEVTFDMQVAAISEHEDKVIRDIDGEELIKRIEKLEKNNQNEIKFNNYIFDFKK